jgi:hypothetical protein
MNLLKVGGAMGMRRILCGLFIALVGSAAVATYFGRYVSITHNDAIETGCTGLAELLDICPSPAKATRADETIALERLPKGIFIGLAISGGGSRAANFSAAALLALDRLGFLEQVNTISSVSGGSLTTGYYGLFSGDKSRWNTRLAICRFLLQ